MPPSAGRDHTSRPLADARARCAGPRAEGPELPAMRPVRLRGMRAVAPPISISSRGPRRKTRTPGISSSETAGVSPDIDSPPRWSTTRHPARSTHDGRRQLAVSPGRTYRYITIGRRGRQVRNPTRAQALARRTRLRVRGWTARRARETFGFTNAEPFLRPRSISSSLLLWSRGQLK